MIFETFPYISSNYYSWVLKRQQSSKLIRPSNHYTYVFGRVGTVMYVCSRDSMSEVWISNKSKMGSKEQKVFEALSYATGSLDGIGFGTFSVHRSSNWFQNASSVRDLPGDICDFILTLVNIPPILCMFMWSFIARRGNCPLQKLVWINAVYFTFLYELVVSDDN